MASQISSPNDMALYFLAIFVPPLAVFFKKGRCSADVWINVALWFLGWIPGVIHAWWIIAKPGPVGPVHV